MKYKSSFLTLIILSSLSINNSYAQRNIESKNSQNIYSIIYEDVDQDMVGVKVADIWWAPVNLKNDKRIFFSYPDSNPCPEGWRLPSEKEIKDLIKLSKSGKGEFDYDTKSYRIKADDGINELIIPANGIIQSTKTKKGVGLFGGFWIANTEKPNTYSNFFFNGNSLSITNFPKNFMQNIRCVSNAYN